MERSEAEESLKKGANFWVRNNEIRIAWKLLAYLGVFFLSHVVFLLVGFLFHANGSFVFSVTQTIAAFAATVFCMLLIERLPMTDIGLWLRTPAFSALAIGVGLAAVMVLLVFIVELSVGFLRTTLLTVETGSSVSIILFGIFHYSLVAVGEEILIRGYPFYILQRRFNGRTAIITTSLIFSIMHIANPSVTFFSLVNIFLAGIWLGMARLLSGGLWLPIGLHFGWNFVMGTILGLPVSGLIGSSMLVTEVFGPQWVTGGYFGPEGGAIATVVVVAGSVALLHPALQGRYSFVQAIDSKQESQETVL